MTVYIVIVTSIHGGIPHVDVFERLQDAEARQKRALVRFPYHEGWSVELLQKHVCPDLSTAFAS